MKRPFETSSAATLLSATLTCALSACAAASSDTASAEADLAAAKQGPVTTTLGENGNILKLSCDNNRMEVIAKVGRQATPGEEGNPGEKGFIDYYIRRNLRSLYPDTQILRVTHASLQSAPGSAWPSGGYNLLSMGHGDPTARCRGKSGEAKECFRSRAKKDNAGPLYIKFEGWSSQGWTVPDTEAPFDQKLEADRFYAEVNGEIFDFQDCQVREVSRKILRQYRDTYCFEAAIRDCHQRVMGTDPSAP